MQTANSASTRLYILELFHGPTYAFKGAAEPRNPRERDSCAALGGVTSIRSAKACMAAARLCMFASAIPF
jgi:hypothetical protein